MKAKMETTGYSNYLSAHPTLNEGFSESKAAWYASTLADLLPECNDAKILEIGPGQGEGLRYLVKSKGFSSVTAIDISEEVINNISRFDTINAHLVTDTIEYLQENENRFSLIIMYHVLEHFGKDKVLDCLNACYDSLIKGGKLVVVVPNVASPIMGVEQQFFDFTHLTAFSPWSIKQVFIMSKFGGCQVDNIWPPRGGVLRCVQKWLQMTVLFLFALYCKIFSGVERRVMTHSMRVVSVREI